jgi:hypothetical protein
LESQRTSQTRRLTPRNRLALDTAEQIAASADRLENQAALIRPTDKRLALQILKEATRLRQCARTLDIQHKRATRSVMDRLRGGTNQRTTVQNPHGEPIPI